MMRKGQGTVLCLEINPDAEPSPVLLSVFLAISYRIPYTKILRQGLHRET